MQIAGNTTLLSMVCRLPAHTQITPVCKDLLRRIFHPLPEHRITILDIQKHPWFTHNLPAQMQHQDWNSQYIQHVDAKARADTIKQTVRKALDRPVDPSLHSASGPTFDSNNLDGLQRDQGHLTSHIYQGPHS